MFNVEVMLSLMYPAGVPGLLSKTQDELQDFFKKLAWDNMSLNKLEERQDTQLMVSMLFMLIFTTRITL